MKLSRLLSVIATLVVIITVVPTFAQNMVEPNVVVDGQIVVDDTVRITEVVSNDAGFIVIHSVDDEGGFGDVIGHAPVGAGVNYNVVVDIDPTNATDTLFAMLHTDDNVVGTYEFGSTDDADGPVIVNEQLIAPTFNVEVLSASDQFVDDIVVIDSITVSTDGFVVVHADNGDGAPGDVIGVTSVVAGISTNVVVELDNIPSEVVFPMLHVDTESLGEYEFGTVEGADAPVVIDGTVATTPIWTVPHMRISDQTVVSSDISDAMGSMLLVKSVLSDGPGFVVIHADDGEGAPGEVIGFAGIDDGLTTDLTVNIDGTPTPILFPMLHVDTGTIGEYEFGTVDGADGPTTVDNNVVVFAIDAAPSIKFDGILQGNILTVEKAVINNDGWLVIHADNGDGAPGDVIGVKRIRQGVNFDISIELDDEMITESVFPMLHYDTNEIGTYEFGTVDDADLPITVNDIVVVGELVPIVIE